LGGANLEHLLSIVAGAGAATVPLGFSIGTFGIFLLKSYFAMRSKFSHHERQMYEARLSQECLQTILREIGAWHEGRQSLLYATATFDHELLSEGIHKWLSRRWNSFNVAFNSALALLISLLIVPIRILYLWSFEPIHGWGCRQWWWAGTNVFSIFLLSTAAVTSWKETMGMIEFQSRRVPVPKFEAARDCFKLKDISASEL
jgi:hypothetical protein